MIVEYDTALLRLRLISEEFGELQEAIMKRDLVATVDALADLEYVVKGTAVSYGIDMEPIFNEIHQSNMSKLRENLEGKILKGRDYRPPDIRTILEAQSR
jgi:predicted HAD superfamily Cof-like phosphohydrolase